MDHIRLRLKRINSQHAEATTITKCISWFVVIDNMLLSMLPTFELSLFGVLTPLHTDLMAMDDRETSSFLKGTKKNPLF